MKRKKLSAGSVNQTGFSNVDVKFKVGHAKAGKPPQTPGTPYNFKVPKKKATKFSGNTERGQF